MGQISTPSLWNNKFIQSKPKHLYENSPVSKGIMTIFEQNGTEFSGLFQAAGKRF